jgi:hypothetical protein
MRTAVELSGATYRALRAEMLERGVRGFSPIVEDALLAYFAATPEHDRLRAAIEQADGAWSDDDARELEDARANAWSTLETDRFSTPTS